jgi:hypothetical protein
MIRVGRRLAVLLTVLTCTCPTAAAADWLITPFIGTAFSGETTMLDLDSGAGQTKNLFGGAVALLSDSVLGLEADFAHSPGFFEGDRPEGVVITSRVTTLTGSVIVAAPLAVTRESLRPYLVAGVGLIQARSRNAADGIPGVTQDVLGVSLGGGAIGMLGERTGVRFDLRRLNAVTGEDGPFARPGVSRLSFWRATVGVVLRY